MASHAVEQKLRPELRPEAAHLPTAEGSAWTFVRPAIAVVNVLVDEAIVQAPVSVYPEFDPIDDQSEAPPIWRSWNRALGEALRRCGMGGFERLAMRLDSFPRKADVRAGRRQELSRRNHPRLDNPKITAISLFEDGGEDLSPSSVEDGCESARRRHDLHTTFGDHVERWHSA